MNGVAVSLGCSQGLDYEDKHAFRSHVPVGFRIERVAFAVGADDAQGIESEAGQRSAQVVGRTDHGLLTIATPEGINCAVQRTQTGGARRAAAHRRSCQVEEV